MRKIIFAFFFLLLFLSITPFAKADTPCPIFTGTNPTNPTNIDPIRINFDRNGLQGSFSIRFSGDNSKIYQIQDGYTSADVGTFKEGGYTFTINVAVLGGKPPTCQPGSIIVRKAPDGATPMPLPPSITPVPYCQRFCGGGVTCATCPNGGFICGTTDTSNCSSTPTPSPTINPASCPICPPGWFWNFNLKTCQNMKDTGKYTEPSSLDCSGAGFCVQGCGCDTNCLVTGTPPPPPCARPDSNGNCGAVKSAIGTINTDAPGFIKSVLSLLLGISGGIAVVLIIMASYKLMTSQGEEEKVKEARESITSAAIGLLFIIFSLVILQIIGADILKIPGFGA